MSDDWTMVNNELVVSWGRYLYWAELMQRRWDMFVTEKGADAKRAIPEWLGVSSYWGSSLYVVIEGWQSAKFKDPIIDALIGLSNYRDVLRRLRNGTFHYQPEVLSEKFTNFFSSPDVTVWLQFLHDEFCRWLRDCIEMVERSTRMSREQTERWHKDVAQLIGWLPLRPAEEELKTVRKKCDEIEQDLDTSGSKSEAARSLRASLGGYDVAVKETARLVKQYRRDRLAQLGLDPNDYNL